MKKLLISILIIGLALGIFFSRNQELKTEDYMGGTTVKVLQFEGDLLRESNGFFVDKNRIVTVGHGVSKTKGALYVEIDAEEYSAELLKLDTKKDLALIKLNTEDEFPAYRMSDLSESIAFVQGYPVPILATDISLEAGDFENSVSFSNLIEFGTEGIEVRSGTPLLNSKEEAVGMTVAKKEDTTYAVPIEIIKKFTYSP